MDRKTDPTDPPAEAPLLYRPEQAAHMLGISRAQLYLLLASGDIASVRIGRLRRIPRTSLDAYVASLEAGAA